MYYNENREFDTSESKIGQNNKLEQYINSINIIIIGLIAAPVISYSKTPFKGHEDICGSPNFTQAYVKVVEDKNFVVNSIKTRLIVEWTFKKSNIANQKDLFSKFINGVGIYVSKDDFNSAQSQFNKYYQGLKSLKNSSEKLAIVTSRKVTEYNKEKKLSLTLSDTYYGCLEEAGLNDGLLNKVRKLFGNGSIAITKDRFDDIKSQLDEITKKPITVQKKISHKKTKNTIMYLKLK